MDQNLLPSNIRFSQDSINSWFSDKLQNQKIGIVLDKIYNGDVSTKAQILKYMKVARAPSKYKKLQHLWFAVNNRSLWVLKELELLGKLTNPLQLKVDPKGIAEWRFSTKNEGEEVLVRNKPVGGTKEKKAPFWDYTTYLEKVDSEGAEMVGGTKEKKAPFLDYTPYLEKVDSEGAEMLESVYDSDEYYE